MKVHLMKNCFLVASFLFASSDPNCSQSGGGPRKAFPQKKVGVSLDRYGDPLPPAAKGRLGTVRFRHSASVKSIAFSPDGKILATGAWDGSLCLWESQTGKELYSLQENRQHATSLAFSPNGKTLASGSFDGAVRLFSIRTRKEIL